MLEYIEQLHQIHEDYFREGPETIVVDANEPIDDDQVKQLLEKISPQ